MQRLFIFLYVIKHGYIAKVVKIDNAPQGTTLEEEVLCKAFNHKKYYYNGPKIDNYEVCARTMHFILESNPPQCVGPDGTHFTGPRE